MAFFSGKIIEAYYANPDNDTVEVIYNDGDKASNCYVPVDSENDFFIGTVDSISIPLSNYQNTTPFSFTKEFDSNQANEDLIYFNYVRNNVYISRSCGYKMEYEIENIIVENDNLNWIEDSIIEKRVVNDENSHHVKIYH